MGCCVVNYKLNSCCRPITEVGERLLLGSLIYAMKLVREIPRIIKDCVPIITTLNHDVSVVLFFSYNNKLHIY